MRTGVMGVSMKQKPALVTAAAMTLATSAAVSGLFLTIGRSVSAATTQTQTVTEYVVSSPSAQATTPVKVVAQPTPAGTDNPFANFGEYFQNEPKSDSGGQQATAGTDGGSQSG